MEYRPAMAQVAIAPIAQALTRDPQGFVAQEEARFSQKIQDVCAAALRREARVIRVCGPSSSGKTTSARKIADQMKAWGRPCYIISLDDFYKERDGELPTWPDGTLNLESPQALDLGYLDQVMSLLWEEGEATFPFFDFHTKRRDPQGGFHLTWTDDSCLVLEGIHALNPLLDANLGGMEDLKVYISVHSDFLDEDGRMVLGARDLRFTRRVLRDLTHRNSPISRTLGLWGGVLRGEELYIRPFREDAHIHLNTTHAYEPFLYTQAMTQALEQEENYGDYRFAMNRILQAQRAFFPIPTSLVPSDSLIQEFL